MEILARKETKAEGVPNRGGMIITGVKEAWRLRGYKACLINYGSQVFQRTKTGREPELASSVERRRSTVLRVRMNECDCAPPLHHAHATRNKNTGYVGSRV